MKQPIYHRSSRYFSLFALIILLFACFSKSLAQPDNQNGLKFNGNNYVNCGNPPGNLFDFTGEGTIEAWVKVTALPPLPNATVFFPILAKDEGPGENNKWIFGLQNGKLVFHINNPNKKSNVPFSQFLTIYSQSFNLEINRYYHFAMTKDKDNRVTFYVNGVNAGSSLLMRKTPIVDAPLLIGKAEPGFMMTGEIGEVRFWKKAMAADEIKEWMLRKLNPSHPRYASLAAAFDPGNGNTIIVTGQSSVAATMQSDPPAVWGKPVLPGWLIVLMAAALIVIALCFILLRMRQKMQQEKMEMELFAAQMSHENNNGIGMMINILSSQLSGSGLGHLEAQLRQRLQTITDLQSAEYMMPGEKGVAFKKYITYLIDKMNCAFNQGRQIIYAIDLPEKIKAKHAMKLAVLIRELTLNSLKHAFNDKTNGEISISITSAGNGYFRFEFSDNGTGILPENELVFSVGTAIINSVSSQLGGRPYVVTDNGYKFVLLFQ